MSTAVGKISETLVVHRFTILHGHDLATRIGSFSNAQQSDGIQFGGIFWWHIASWQRCNLHIFRLYSPGRNLIFRKNLRFPFGNHRHNAVAALELAHRNGQRAVGFHLARQQFHNGIYRRHFVLIGHYHTFYIVVDAEHIQSIRTSEQIENHIVLCHKTVEELHRFLRDAVVFVGEHRRFLDVDHHQIEFFQFLQPFR